MCIVVSEKSLIMMMMMMMIIMVIILINNNNNDHNNNTKHVVRLLELKSCTELIFYLTCGLPCIFLPRNTL